MFSPWLESMGSSELVVGAMQARNRLDICFLQMKILLSLSLSLAAHTMMHKVRSSKFFFDSC